MQTSICVELELLVRCKECRADLVATVTRDFPYPAGPPMDCITVEPCFDCIQNAKTDAVIAFDKEQH